MMAAILSGDGKALIAGVEKKQSGWCPRCLKKIKRCKCKKGSMSKKKKLRKLEKMAGALGAPVTKAYGGGTRQPLLTKSQQNRLLGNLTALQGPSLGQVRESLSAAVTRQYWDSPDPSVREAWRGRNR